MGVCEHIPSDGATVAKAMNTIVEHLNNGDAVDAVWYQTYPDGASDEELEELSRDADSLDGLFRTFRQLIASVGKDGLCVEEEYGLLLVGHDDNEPRRICLRAEHC